MNKPKKIIIHHSLTKDNELLSSFDAIKRYHMETNGWNDIGYQYVLEYVNRKVVVRPGRPENVTGAHTQGQNSQSVGVCVVGNFDEDKPTEAMYKAVADMCVTLRRKHGKIPIQPHSMYAPKSCPGKNFDIAKLILLVEKLESPVPVKRPAAPPPAKYGVVTVTTLNVRENRSTDSKVIGKLKKGDKVRLDKQMGDWWSVYYGPHGGFVHKDYIMYPIK